MVAKSRQAFFRLQVLDRRLCFVRAHKKGAVGPFASVSGLVELLPVGLTHTGVATSACGGAAVLGGVIWAHGAILERNTIQPADIGCECVAIKVSIFQVAAEHRGIEFIVVEGKRAGYRAALFK